MIKNHHNTIKTALNKLVNRILNWLFGFSLDFFFFLQDNLTVCSKYGTSLQLPYGTRSSYVQNLNVIQQLSHYSDVFFFFFFWSQKNLKTIPVKIGVSVWRGVFGHRFCCVLFSYSNYSRQSQKFFFKKEKNPAHIGFDLVETMKTCKIRFYLDLVSRECNS